MSERLYNSLPLVAMDQIRAPGCYRLALSTARGILKRAGIRHRFGVPSLCGGHLDFRGGSKSIYHPREAIYRVTCPTCFAALMAIRLADDK